jgi:hypothetical protein
VLKIRVERKLELLAGRRICQRRSRQNGERPVGPAFRKSSEQSWYQIGLLAQHAHHELLNNKVRLKRVWTITEFPRVERIAIT